MAQKKKNIPTPKNAKQYDKLITVGNRHYDKGEFTEALRHFSKALNYKDYSPNTLVIMARCLFNIGRKNEAIRLMEHALHQSANNPSICESLGSACLSFDFNELAIKFFTIYIQLNPTEPLGYNNLATALREDGQLDQSIQLLQDIVPQYPENAFLWNSLGAGVSFRDGYIAAMPFYEEAYRLDPTQMSFVNNLSLAYVNLGQTEKAWEFSKLSVELAPNSAANHRAVVHNSYRLGKFDEAFDALAWHNHPSEPGSVFMPYKIEKWQGHDLKDKTILIGAEQGIGDEILFASLYPAIIREAKHVIIGCDKRLVPLFKSSFKEATILPYVAGQHSTGYTVRLYEGIEPDKIDYMCLYTDVMRFKWRSADDIPDMTDGFLTPAPEQVSYWKKKLAELPHKINVGIAWRSGLSQAKRSMFYARLLDWVPVLKTKNVNFINAQYGDHTNEIKELFDKHGVKLHDFDELNLKDDFEGTTALLQNCDLMIGPSTSPVMQAAAAGTRTWWVNYNFCPWWNFGQVDRPVLYPKNRTIQKPPTLEWPEFFPLFAEEEFAPWVEQKLKEISA